MIKTKPGFLLRRLGEEAMVVALGEAGEQFNGMIRLNPTGVLYWQALEKGTTVDQLVADTLARFDGVDEASARRDVLAFLDKMAPALDNDGTDH